MKFKATAFQIKAICVQISVTDSEHKFKLQNKLIETWYIYEVGVSSHACINSTKLQFVTIHVRFVYIKFFNGARINNITAKSDYSVWALLIVEGRTVTNSC